VVYAAASTDRFQVAGDVEVTDVGEGAVVSVVVVKEEVVKRTRETFGTLQLY